MKPRKGDYIIAAAVIAVAVVIWVSPLFGEKGEAVQISQSGKNISVSLSDEAEYTFDGCIVAVSDGEVYIKETNCPDRVCEKTGRISKAGEAIICVPNKLEIKIAGTEGHDVVAG